MKNDCVLFSPSSHYDTPLHSFDGGLFYFQVSCLMNTQFIHLQPEKGVEEGEGTGQCKTDGEEIKRNEREDK